MTQVAGVVYAPKVNAQLMWHMSAEKFNDWRKENDYPRIIKFLKKKLPDFEEWMEDQLISDELMIKHSPSTFLKETTFYIYKVLENETKENEFISAKKHAINDTIFHKRLIKQCKKVVPYPSWFKRKTKKEPHRIMVDQKSGRSHIVMSGLELLDIGNCKISNIFLGNRKLDFVNISDLDINNCYNNTNLEISFSSAINITIRGDLPFVDAYQTSFSEWFSSRLNNLKLRDGAFQRWRLIECDINVFADNAIIQMWEVSGEFFDATINSTDIRDCQFKTPPIKYPIQLGRAQTYHSNIKRLYSQLGKKKAASDHFYLEKTFERKSFLHVRANHRNSLFGKSSKIEKGFVHLVFFLKYVKSGFLNILWGYGERPARVFLLSILTILSFSLCYCFLPGSSTQTCHNFPNALYDSMVTFTTGNITQTHDYIKLLSGLEALLGLSFWAILIAGFTNNAKDY